MKLLFGDMWSVYEVTDLFIVTTNSFVRKDGRLVMGRGIAAETRKRFPKVDLILGRTIQQRCGHLGIYGLLVSPLWPDRPSAKLAAFQVKTHFKEPASLTLIAFSTNRLYSIASQYPELRFDMNFPGIGNGGLMPRYKEVLKIIEVLPDNVHVWQYR